MIQICHGQNWPQIYSDTGGYQGTFAVETYDKGFLIGGAAFEGTKNSVIYKTDINGNILWQRIVATSGCNTNIAAICSVNDGSYIISGSISRGKTEAFLLKLDACGEIEWSKRYNANISVSNTNICIMKDGGFVFNLEESTNNGKNYGGWLCRTDKNGNIVWSVNQINNEPVNISISDSDNILVTGFDFYQVDNGPPTGVIPQSLIFVTKLDSDGKQIQHFGTSDFWMNAQQTLQSAGGNFLTFGDDDFNPILGLHLYLWNIGGKLLDNIAIIDTGNALMPKDFIRTGDSSYLFLASRRDGKTGDYSMRVFRTESNIIIAKDTLYQLGSNIIPSTISATSDNKYIISGTILKNGISDGIYVAKINSSLKLDSFYSTKYNYDYLCANGVPNAGTILLDSAPVKNLAVDETGKHEEFSIYPNPAKDFVNFNCSGLSADKVQFTIYNILGLAVMSSAFSADWTGDLSRQVSLPNISAGLYMVELVQGNKRLVQKVIVAGE